MSLAYRQILDQVIEAVTGLPTTGINVEEDPGVAIEKGLIPCVVVKLAEIPPPQIIGESQATETWREIHTPSIDVIGIGNTIAVRDQISLEIMVALLQISKPGRRRRYAGSFPEESSEGAKRLYAIRHRFEIEFHVLNTAPEILITEG